MTLWPTKNAWDYHYFEPDMDPAELPVFESLIRIWQSKRNGRRVPSWADFDFFDFKGWHGDVTVYDVTYDPFDYVTRLSGTRMDELFGRTLTNLNREDFNKLYARDSETDSFSAFICENLYISYSEGSLNAAGKEFKPVLYLELPLSDDGVRAQHTIEVIIPVGTR